MEVGHQLGNFHNYYSFHGADDRLSLLYNGFFSSLTFSSVHLRSEKRHVYILDIGCNDGTLSHKLYEKAIAELPDCVVFLVGIDLDSDLIAKATAATSATACGHIKFLSLNILDDHDLTTLKTFMASRKIDSFHLVTLFSITMWIHLNHGDQGLNKFLEIAAFLTQHSLLIEPQPWKCYKTAAKRCRKLNLPGFPHPPNTLTTRNINGDVVKILNAFNMALDTPLGTETWGRSLLHFRLSDAHPLNRNSDSDVQDWKSQIYQKNPSYVEMIFKSPIE